ncbi:MAG TPA: DNA primase noncatalytic subunit PriX [Nitrososphaerales archaeon]|nr:DNA primase noncatalytic subunit PriX [Nitrososphaerales archaeon]
MPYGGPLLSDLELRYPFAPRSRKFFESIPVEDGLASREVVGQTESRLLSALGRVKYESHISDLVEFSSFFAAALVASQDPVLTSRFSKKEAERAKEFFVREEPRAKAEIMVECFGGAPPLADIADGRASYSMPFERYLSLVSRFELTKNPKWKLARQELKTGTVYLSDNMLNDLFADSALAAIADGVRNLRRGPFPRQLLGVKEGVMQYVPSPKPKTNKGYLYVEDLLLHPVSDGRHRLVWLVLAPYLVNVKKLDDDAAIEKIRAFVAAAGETSAMRRFVEYNVRRVRRNGLLPPTFATLKAEHPDIYWLLPKDVVAGEAAKKSSP